MAAPLRRLRHRDPHPPDGGRRRDRAWWERLARKTAKAACDKRVREAEASAPPIEALTADTVRLTEPATSRVALLPPIDELDLVAAEARLQWEVRGVIEGALAKDTNHATRPVVGIRATTRSRSRPIKTPLSGSTAGLDSPAARWCIALCRT